MANSRVRIADPLLKVEMFKLFDDGITLKEQVWTALKRKYLIGNKRSYEKYREYHTEWAELTVKAQEQATALEEQTRLRKQIESRIARIAGLQKQKEALADKLEKGTTRDYFIVKANPKAYDRELTPSEIANLTRSYKTISAEISRLESDYPVEKSSNIGDDLKGVDIKNQKDLQPSEFDELVKLLNTPKP